MGKQAVNTNDAPAAIGPYSQAVIAQGVLFVSGQIPADPATGQIVDGGVEVQAERALANLKAVLEAGGARLADVVKTTVFLKNMDDFAAINAVYASYFEAPYPARACVEVARLPKDVLVEIEAVALVAPR